MNVVNYTIGDKVLIDKQIECVVDGAYTNEQGTSLIIVDLGKDGIMTNHSSGKPVYIRLMVVHPANLTKVNDERGSENQ